MNYFIAHDRLEFEPGTQYEYSSTGHMLLAEIIERVSGESFEQYMQNNIFIPSGMINSYIADEHSTLRTNDALNYGTHNTFYGENIYVNGSGGEVSSINDMYHFITALFRGEVVSSDTFNMYSRLINHGGKFDSFRNYMDILHVGDNDWRLVIMANDGSATSNHEYLINLVTGFMTP